MKHARVRPVVGAAAFLALAGVSFAQSGSTEQDSVITESITTVVNGVAESTLDVHPQIQKDPVELVPKIVPIQKLTLPDGEGQGFEPAPRKYGFNGIGNTGWTPPDPSIGVGPNHVVTVVNSTVSFYSKSGSLQFSQTLQSFFSSVGAGNFCFDPKCMYDEGSGRYFVLALEVYSSTAFITFAISDDSDPNGTWYKYRTDAKTRIGGSDYWVDYPGLGSNANAFLVTGNLFGFSSGFGGVKYRVIEKASILTGGAAVLHDLRDGSSASAQVAVVHGTALGLFVTSVANSSSIRLQAITNETSAPVLTTRDVAVPSFSSPPAAPNFGGGTLDTLDARLINAEYRGTRLVTGHGVTGPANASAARWYEFDTNNWPSSGNPTLAQSGDVSLKNADWLWYPALAISSNGDIGMVMAHSQVGIPAGILYTRQQVGDPAGSMQGPWGMFGGQGGSSGRWGDYFDAAVDGADDLGLWGIGEYVNSGGSWRTYISKMEFDFTLPSTGFLFSVKEDAVLGGAPIDDGDILYYNPASGEVNEVLDISDVVSTNLDVDGCAVLSDGSILVSFVTDETIAGLIGGPNGNLVEDEDIIRFVPTKLGGESAGSWEFYFDGSDVGLSPQKHDIDSFAVDSSDTLYISLIGPWDLGGGFAGKDEDVLLFTPTSLGANTAGTFSMFLDGNDTDVRLGSNGEDIDAFSFDDLTGELTISTFNDFTVPGISGQDNDLPVFTGTQFGTDPIGTWSLYFDGATLFGLGDIDALHRLD